jgi:hypothetical protein
MFTSSMCHVHASLFQYSMFFHAKKTLSFTWPCLVQGWKDSLNHVMLYILFSFPSVALHRASYMSWFFSFSMLCNSITSCGLQCLLSSLLVCCATQLCLVVSNVCYKKFKFDTAQGWYNTWPSVLWSWSKSKSEKNEFVMLQMSSTS